MGASIHFYFLMKHYTQYKSIRNDWSPWLELHFNAWTGANKQRIADRHI